MESQNILKFTSNFKTPPSIPLVLENLIANKDFKLKYIEPFLVNTQIGNTEKNRLVEEVVVGIQTHHERFLTRREIKSLLKSCNTYQLEASPLIPSIRHEFNLEGLPDSWIEEAYFNTENISAFGAR